MTRAFKIIVSSSWTCSLFKPLSIFGGIGGAGCSINDNLFGSKTSSAGGCGCGVEITGGRYACGCGVAGGWYCCGCGVAGGWYCSLEDGLACFDWDLWESWFTSPILDPTTYLPNSLFDSIIKNLNKNCYYYKNKF